MSPKPTRPAPRWSTRATALALVSLAALAALVLLLNHDVSALRLANGAVDIRDDAAPQDSDESRLRMAALRRFDGAVASVVVDGKIMPVADEGTADEIKVNLFRKTLAGEEQARDPALRPTAEAALRQVRPAHAALTWDDIAGNHEVDVLLPKANECQDLFEKPSTYLATSLSELGCLRSTNIPNRWGADARVTVTLNPIAAGTPDWERLVSDVMADLAIRRFLAQSDR